MLSIVRRTAEILQTFNVVYSPHNMTDKQHWLTFFCCVFANKLEMYGGLYGLLNVSWPFASDTKTLSSNGVSLVGLPLIGELCRSWHLLYSVHFVTPCFSAAARKARPCLTSAMALIIRLTISRQEMATKDKTDGNKTGFSLIVKI